jgi:hypothetical protein
LHDDDMPPPINPDSAYEAPAGRAKISARVSEETKRKLATIMAIWKVQTRVEKEATCAAQGKTSAETKEIVADAVKDVDLTYVIDRLLTRGTQTELAPWGGNPETPEKLAALLKLVEQQAKK